MLNLHTKPAFTLIEVAVSVTLLAMVLLTCFKLVSDSLIYTKNTGQRTQASYLASQDIEAVKYIAKIDPSTIASLSDGTYYPKFAGTTWHLPDDPSDEASSDLLLDHTQFHHEVVITNSGLAGVKKIISRSWWGSDTSDKSKLVEINYYLSY